MSTTTLGFEWNVNGTLTDVDSIVLQDPTNAYGVKRNDTGATVVNAGTTMTRVGTGSYSYQFTDPAAGLTYGYYAKVTYLGVPYYFQRTKTSPVSVFDVTLSQARALLLAAYIRSSGNSGTDTNRMNWAIEFACNELLRRTRCNADTISFALTTSVDTYSLQSVLTGLRAGYIMSARIGYQTLDLVDFNQIQFLNNTPNLPGYLPLGYQPPNLLKYAHEVPTTITIWPTPLAASPGNLTLRYWLPCVNLTGADDSTLINVPRHALIPALTYGATAALGFKDPDEQFESVAWRRFLDEIIPGIEATEQLAPVVYSAPDDNE